MKKMYFLALSLIVVITALFLFFSTDTDILNKKFLSSFGIQVSKNATQISQIKIPKEFDEIYENYNLMQIECGLDLSPYKGKTATRYTYIMENFPEKGSTDILVNVICVKNRPVAGDIMSPSISGFIKPLNFLMQY